MDLVSIGEFAPVPVVTRALRLYDELGLLSPARVDADSGYRWYGTSQLEQARLKVRTSRWCLPCPPEWVG
jgi:DNA-binding transcriptional MerR regulator